MLVDPRQGRRAAVVVNPTSIRVQLGIDGGVPIQARVRSVAIGNVGQLQASLELLPDALPDDGVLDVAVLVSHSPLDWARIASRIITRRGYVDRRYTTFQGKKIEVRFGSAQPRPLDGDLIEAGHLLAVQIETAAVVVRVPADEPGTTSGEDPR